MMMMGNLKKGLTVFICGILLTIMVSEAYRPLNHVDENSSGSGSGELACVVSVPLDDPVNPQRGTLRYATNNNCSLIPFSGAMVIRLKQEINVKSSTTIDAGDLNVSIEGAGLAVKNATNVALIGLHISDVVPTSGSGSGGNGIHIHHSINITIRGLTISNCYGVAIASYMDSRDVKIFNNSFVNNTGEGVLRVSESNVDFEGNHIGPWGTNAILGTGGGSIICRGNTFRASDNHDAKKVLSTGLSGMLTLDSEGNVFENDATMN